MKTLDSLDLLLLQQLQLDASISNQDLAKKVAIAPATCLRRVKILKEQGIIAKTIAILDQQQLKQVGIGCLTAIVEIVLDKQGDEWIRDFQRHVQQQAVVQQCYRVSSGVDFILVVAVADMEQYLQLAKNLLSEHKNVRNVKTYFSTQTSKFNPAFDLPEKLKNK